MVGGSSRGNPGEAEAQNKSFPRPHIPTPQEKYPKGQKVLGRIKSTKKVSKNSK